MAAWLYGGEGAVLSHRGAGLSWGLGQFPTIDITVGRARRGVAGLSFHRAVVPAGEVVTRDGMRVTTPARTLLDLAAITPRPRMQRLYTEAEVLGLIDQTAVRRVLESHPGRRGVRLLGALAGLDLGERRGRIRSPLEARFRSLLERSQLPRPEYNARLDVGGCCYEIDVLWRRSRLAVELDGRHAHQTTERFDTDRGRDRRLLAHGWRPTRVTSAHLRRPQAVLAELQQLLADDPTTD